MTLETVKGKNRLGEKGTPGITHLLRAVFSERRGTGKN